METEKYAISIDLGGTYIKYALIRNDGSTIIDSKILTEAEKGREHVIGLLKQIISEVKLISDAKNYSIAGVGLGTPGIIDNGLILGGAENLPEWDSLPLAGILNKIIDVPVLIENDANLMGLGEYTFGLENPESDIIFITVGTGIGGAMILNGKLYGGYRNRGAELGHIRLSNNGEKCSCGTHGCFEAHASVTALIRDYKYLLTRANKKIPPQVDGKYIVNRYLNNEKEAGEAFNIHFDYMAAGLASLVNIFSPQRIVIGGGISEAEDFYINEIEKRTKALAMKETQVFTRISKAKLGNKAGTLGAAALVFKHEAQVPDQVKSMG
jgi:glucokinase